MRLTVPCAAAACAALVLAGCGSNASPVSPAPNVGSTSVQSGASSPVSATGGLTRWWSTSRDPAGSAIDANDPTADAASLSRSRSEYCGILRATAGGGDSLLGRAAGARIATAQAFVAEVEAVAPRRVSQSWHVLGGAIVTLVSAGSDPSSAPDVDARAVHAAAVAIAKDSKQRCGLALSQ